MSMSQASMEDAVIGPLVHRHAEDAAFYWTLLDSSTQSVKLYLDRLEHFQVMLDAHLEGLSVAGTEGWAHAFAALEKWKKPGEAFVCTWLAVQIDEPQNDEPQKTNALLTFIRGNPEGLLRGAIAALAWSPASKRNARIAEWLSDESDAVVQVAALRAMALASRDELDAMPSVSRFLQSPSPFVRTAACRAVSFAPGDCDVALRVLMADDDLAVRAEAALALAAHGERRDVLPVLWQCVAKQATDAAELTGWYRMQAERRLDRWVRHLAWLVPAGHADLSELYRFLPPRIGLSFALYHADPADLPYVVSRMDDPAHSRYAGWVWQMLTGADLRAAGLVLPEPPLKPEQLNVVDHATLDVDRGLPLPDAAAVADAQASMSGRFDNGQRTLLGRELSVDRLFTLVNEAPQAVRAIAAHALRYEVPGFALHVRAPAWAQKRQIRQLQSTVSA